MKICDAHWQELRQAIDNRGLTRIIAKDGEHAAKNMAAQLQGGDTKDNYDPLMSAVYAIWGNAIEAFGLDIMRPDAPCPLCVLDQHIKECTDEECGMKQSGSDWIGYAADGQIDAITQMGLLGKPN
jgi:hypothetical protein